MHDVGPTMRASCLEPMEVLPSLRPRPHSEEDDVEFVRPGPHGEEPQEAH